MEKEELRIGNWVLKDGEPYRWEAADYLRTKKGMENIKPMPWSDDVMMANDIKNGENRFDDGISTPFGKDDTIINISHPVYYLPEFAEPYEHWNIHVRYHETAIGEGGYAHLKCHHVHEVQNLLYDLGMKEYAMNLKVL